MPRNLESGEPSSADNQDNIIPPVEEPQPSFLEGYRVHEKDEAKRAAERKELHTGEKGIVNNRTERVQAYLDRLENVFLNKDEATRERNIELLKPLIHKNTIIKEENFPDSYFEFQKQQAKERGLGEVSFDKQEKKEEVERVQETQRISLDSWIDYLTSDDCKYPVDVKYFAMQGVLKLGKFDTEKYSFAKRGKDTAAPFAEIDREALSTVLGALDARHHKGDISGYSPKLLELIDNKKGFGDMYAETMRDLDSKADKESLLPITDGEWRVFEKGSDPKDLSEALAGKRSNLCIADIGAATRYLESGSVEVFFSNNHAKQPTIPRIAVAFNEQGVYEVRGTFNKSEDIDPQMSETDTLSRRIKNLPGGEGFMEKDACMKKMTALERKIKNGGELIKDELQFLYEMDGSVEGFGYQKDPRIAELRDKRNLQEDLPVIFECQPNQIAFGKEQINKDTIVYIGEWTPEIMNLMPESVKYIYEKFPEIKVFLRTIEINPEIKNAKDAENVLKQNGFKVPDYVENMLRKVVFSGEKQKYEVVSFSVESFGFKNGAKLKDIFAKAKEIGLELCPAELGLQLRLQYKDQPSNEYLRLGMEPIGNSVGYLRVFRLFYDVGGLWLGGGDGGPDRIMAADHRFIFVRSHK